MNPHESSTKRNCVRVMNIVTSSLSVRFLEGQTGYLGRNGYEVQIVSAAGDELTRAQGVGVQTVAVPIAREISLWKDLISLFRIAAVISRLRPTVTNVGTPKAGFMGGISAWILGIPCRYYTLHGLRCETTTGLKRKLLLLTERIACACAHRVICVSESLRQKAIELGVVSIDKTVVLAAGSYSGVNPARFAPTAEATARARRIRQKMGIPEGAPVVGFVGRLTKDKGISELVEAYLALRADIPELKLLLVGNLEEGDPLPPRIRRQIECERGILRTGFVNDPSEYYHVMDVFALPDSPRRFSYTLRSKRSCRQTSRRGSGHRSGRRCDRRRHRHSRPRWRRSSLGKRFSYGDPRSESGDEIRICRARTRSARLSARDHLGSTCSGIFPNVGGERTICSTSRGERSPRLIRIHSCNSPMKLLIKRIADILISCGALLITVPLGAIIALAMRLCDRGPVLFRQTRPGYHGIPFTLLKFRTMSDSRDDQGFLLADTARLTAIGKFLRRTSLDELPQLWNVVRGDMSLVGPRPLLMKYMERYTAEQLRRHDVKPGMTGWAQIHGRNAVTWSERFALDLWYVDHWCLTLDAWILLQTPLQILKRTGISQPGHVSMPEFLGSEQSKQ